MFGLNWQRPGLRYDQQIVPWLEEIEAIGEVRYEPFAHNIKYDNVRVSQGTCLVRTHRRQK